MLSYLIRIITAAIITIKMALRSGLAMLDWLFLLQYSDVDAAIDDIISFAMSLCMVKLKVNTMYILQ